MTITDLLRSSGRDGHLLLLHSSEGERRASLSAWIRHGLDRDEKIIYAEHDDEPYPRSLLGVLADHGVDGETATDEGRLTRLSAEDFYLTPCLFDTIDDALDSGFPAVRLTSESDVALSVLSPGNHLETERQAEEMVLERPVSVLCQYPRRDLASRRLDEIAATHRGGLHERQLQVSGSRGRLHLTGEVDLANEDVLAAALRAAVSNGSAVLSVDLSGIRFLGAGGVRALEVTTRRFRTAGGRLRLVAPCDLVERVLRLSRFDQRNGVELVEAWAADVGTAV
jgi:anti-anti-sigma factor